MTTTTTFQGMEPGSKSSSRVLRPPGGGSNISFGADEEKPPVRKDKMASSVFAEPEDPYANRRNNPPGGKPTGVLCGEPSAPLRRGGNHNSSHPADAPAMVRMQRNLYVRMKSAPWRLKPFQRRPLQPRSRLEDCRPAAGIHPGASPASSWVELPRRLPLFTSTFPSSFSFFISTQVKESRPFIYTTGILKIGHRSPPHPQVHCFDTSLFWKPFCTVFIVYFDRSTLCSRMCTVQSLPLSLRHIISAGGGTRITFLISANDSPSLTRLQQHKL